MPIERKNTAADGSPKDQALDGSERDIFAIVPRLWVVMIPLTIPFMNICFNFFEAMERRGPVWSFLASPLLSATAIAYVGLFFLLKKSNR